VSAPEVVVAGDATAAQPVSAEQSATGDGRRRRWTEHRAHRRAAFVASGAAAVDAHGPHASAEQIAALAGVSRTVLYRYFRDKDDLAQAIAEKIVGEVVGSVLPHLELTAASTPGQIINSAIGTIIGWFDDHPNYYAFLRERNNQSLGTVESTLADRVAYLLQALMASFGLDGEEAEPAAYGMVGYVEASCAWWLARRETVGAMSRDRFTRTVCEAVWRMIDGFAHTNGVSIGRDDPLPAVAAR
jgi:AcrR family transcriptional regulator